MTNVPEVYLAREAQLAYCTICLVTDYDCWMDDPAQHVSVDAFMATYQEAIEKVKWVIAELLQHPLTDTPEDIRQALNGSVLTPDAMLSDDAREWLSVLRA